MKILKFTGNIELDEVFNSHRQEIYDNILNSIESHYLEENNSEVTVVQISINELEYTINLTRDKYIGGLENAITYYESSEEYEKCARCVSIIKDLKKMTEV